MERAAKGSGGARGKYLAQQQTGCMKPWRTLPSGTRIKQPMSNSVYCDADLCLQILQNISVRAQEAMNCGYFCPWGTRIPWVGKAWPQRRSEGQRVSLTREPHEKESASRDCPARFITRGTSVGWVSAWMHIWTTWEALKTTTQAPALEVPSELVWDSLGC